MSCTIFQPYFCPPIYPDPQLYVNGKQVSCHVQYSLLLSANLSRSATLYIYNKQVSCHVQCFLRLSVNLSRSATLYIYNKQVSYHVQYSLLLSANLSRSATLYVNNQFHASYCIKALLLSACSIVVEVAFHQVAGHTGLITKVALESLPSVVGLFAEGALHPLELRPVRLEVGIREEESTPRQRNVKHFNEQRVIGLASLSVVGLVCVTAPCILQIIHVPERGGGGRGLVNSNPLRDWKKILTENLHSQPGKLRKFVIVSEFFFYNYNVFDSSRI